MKKLACIALSAFTLLTASGAIAAPRTVAFEVTNVSCVTCAPIVKKVLSRIPGVSQVVVIERARPATATVTFDDERVTTDALAQAVSKAGFPTRVKEAAMPSPGSGIASR